MRLTLRTLLAYLDDVLEPNAAREIGAKLGESPVAASLVDRICDVIKRRRIGTPDVSGPGAKPDPNLVGEYLDNTLVGSDVEDIERICLDSDMHLAEVAACHKILTLVLGEPVEVSRPTRERMYALGATMPSEHANIKGNGQISAGRPESVSSLSGPTMLPEELARPRSKGTLWVAAGLLIVFGAWIGLVISDHGLLSFGGPKDAGDASLALNDGVDNSSIDLSGDVNPADVDDAGVDAGVDSSVDGSATTESEQSVTAIPNTTLPDDAINPPPPDDLAEGEAMESDADAAVAVIPDPSTITVPENSDLLPMPEDGVDDQSTDAEPQLNEDQPPASPGSPVQVLYTSHEDVLLHEMTEQPGWYVLPRNSVIRDGQSIACPEPFEAELLVSGAMCRIRLIGGTRLRSVGPTVAGPFGFEVERGSIVVSHTGMPDDPAALFGIVIGGEMISIEMQAGSILGIEVDRLSPSGRDEGMYPAPETMTTMFIPKGSCRLKGPDGSEIDFAPEINGQLTWESSTDLLVPTVLQSTPAWYQGIGTRTGAARQTARRFEEMFLVGQPVESTMPTIVRHVEPRFSEFAVRTLGLIGDYPQLVRAIESGKEGSILAAADELAQWLPLDPENGNRLREELSRNHRETEIVDILDRLIWGFDLTDVMRPDVSQMLVEWMLHAHPAVRVLAFETVEGFTGISQNYHPMLPPAQLAASVDNWREYLRRQGGALVAPE